MTKRRIVAWIPLWVDKWLFGSTRLELTSEERSVFIDLLCLASINDGFIGANEQTPYPHSQICGMLNISNELLKRTIDKCVKTGKIIDENGVYRIVNWSKYKLSDAQYGIVDIPERKKTKEKKDDDSGSTFKKPTIEEIREYCESRNNGIDAEQFYNFYESKGWMVGKNKMKDWKCAVITWEKMGRQNGSQMNIKRHKYDEALFKQYCDLRTKLGDEIDRRAISDWLDRQPNPDVLLDRKITELKKRVEQMEASNTLMNDMIKKVADSKKIN